MNETLRVIRSRRSTRRYRPEQIPEQDLEAILESALYAPSGMNEQRWHFTVVQDKRVLEQMAAIVKENMAASASPMGTSTCAASPWGLRMARIRPPRRARGMW